MACAWAGFNFPVLNVWAVGACLCVFEGILHSKHAGNQAGFLLDFIPVPFTRTILLFSAFLGAPFMFVPSFHSACRKICRGSNPTCGTFLRGVTASSTKLLPGPARRICVLNSTWW